MKEYTCNVNKRLESKRQEIRIMPKIILLQQVQMVQLLKDDKRMQLFLLYSNYYFDQSKKKGKRKKIYLP